jgi:hypothetical protein
MIRFSRLPAILAAIVMTSFTLGPIGTSAVTHNDSHPVALASRATPVGGDQLAMLYHVLHRFV